MCCQRGFQRGFQRAELITVTLSLSLLMGSLLMGALGCVSLGGGRPALARPALPKALDEDTVVREWADQLPQSTPSPLFSLRRWELTQAEQARPAEAERRPEEDRAPAPGWLSALGGYLPREWLSERGMGGGRSPQMSLKEMARQGFELDEHTDAKAPPFSYERSFVPSVQPHGRARVFNRVNEDGGLGVYQGSVLRPMAEPINLERCLRGAGVPLPDATHNLMIDEGRWVAARALDLSCARALCATLERECFLGAFRVRGWDGAPMSVPSVSPDQSLVLASASPLSLRLLRDEAHMYYLTSAPPSGASDPALRRSAALTARWAGLEVIHLLVSSPRAYFSASWEFRGTQVSARGAESDASLPEGLRGEALSLLPQLGLNPQGDFQGQLYALVSWFRSFELGALPESGGEGEGAELYKRVTLSQRGVCRHRAYAFMITARAMGVPTRLVTNAVHAFVEVRDPSGAWRRVDLGGEAPIERFTSASPELNTHDQARDAVFPDNLPSPSGALERERALREAQLRGFYERSPSARSAALEGGARGAPSALEALADHFVTGASSGRGPGEGAGAREGERGAGGGGDEAGALAVLSDPAGSLPALSDDPSLTLQIEALVEGYAHTLSAQGGKPSGGGASERSGGGSERGANAEGAGISSPDPSPDPSAHTRPAARPSCAAPLTSRPRPPLKALRPPRRPPAVTARLLGDAAGLVGRCALITVEGKAEGGRAVKGAQVRLFALFEGERRDLGAWAELDAGGRFRVQAQLPADAPLGPQGLLVRVEAEGWGVTVEAEVAPPQPPRRGRRLAR